MSTWFIFLTLYCSHFFLLFFAPIRARAWIRLLPCPDTDCTLLVRAGISRWINVGRAISIKGSGTTTRMAIANFSVIPYSLPREPIRTRQRRMSVSWPPIFLLLSLVVDRGEGRRLFVFPPTHPSILLFRLSRISLFDLARQYTPDGMKTRRGRQSKDSLLSHHPLPPLPLLSTPPAKLFAA